MPDGKNAEEIIRALGLQPHPEGGHYAESFRSEERVVTGDGRSRSAGTAIYFLLGRGDFSALHRVAADEAWHHYQGASLEIVTISPDGILASTLIGQDLAAGERPQHVVPAGHWQGARPVGTGSAGFALVGCTVSPGFDFADFQMPGRSALLELFPAHRERILEFTCP